MVGLHDNLGMNLSWASPIRPMEVVLDVVATQVVGISLLLWVGVVGDVRDVGVAGLLKVLVAIL